jgi:hypothetical protein
MIGLPTMEHIRRAEFLTHFMGLQKPSNSLLLAVHGQSPASSRNFIIQAAIEQNCTHVFFIDDDVVPPFDAIEQLLKHDKDIVTGLYLMRSFPHNAVLFDEAFESGHCKFMYLTPNKTGLVPIVNCGLGIVLIKIEVFKAMQKPWITLGEIDKDGWCDDISFFNRARRAGFEMYCDLNVTAGHMVNPVAWPVYENGQWTTQYRFPQGNVAFPQHMPDQMQVENERKAFNRDLMVAK